MSYEPIDLETLTKRKKDFLAAVRPISAWNAALVMNKLTSGINWTGCNKGHMAEQWSKGDAVYRGLGDITIERLQQAVAAHIERKIPAHLRFLSTAPAPWRISDGKGAVIVDKYGNDVALVYGETRDEAIKIAAGIVNMVNTGAENG